MRSVDFVADYGLQDDVQIFPLSILPGTDFRRRSRELGLRFENRPPYTVSASRGFSPEDFLLAYDYAETRLDTVFFPLPDLDVSWRLGAPRGLGQAVDLQVRLGGAGYVAKLMVNRLRPLDEIRRLARRLTQPYQVLVGPEPGDMNYLKKILAITTAENPFTPLEIVFFEPAELPRTREILAALNLSRPHFLDGDLRFLFPKPGNRAALFTLVSENPEIRFQGEMERQVRWWRKPELPDLDALGRFEHLDGVLIDTPVSEAAVRRWQDRSAKDAAERFHISFADAALQRRWLLLASPDEYVEKIMTWTKG